MARMFSFSWHFTRLFSLLSACLLAGCQSMAYYTQAVQGQSALLWKRQPVSRLLANPRTSPRLRQHLEYVQRIRAFAAQELGLPAKRQYTDYVELGREYPVWSVMAAPELSLTPKTWCYWFVGCLSYRGFFKEAAAQSYAQALEREGWEVYSSGVPAYSTLGWFRDPVLSSFVYEPEADLAEMIFHELTHQRLFVAGDTTFNESLAVTVAEEGLRRYSQRYPQDLDVRARARQRRDDFIRLVLTYRQRLEAVFAQGDDASKRRGKAEVYAALQHAYAEQKQQWGGYAGYDSWFATLNNAKLNTIGTYYDLVPAFQALLRQQGGDLEEFMAECRKLSRLSLVERHRRLLKLVTPVAVVSGADT